MDNLKRYIRLRGISVENLQMQVADPSAHVQVQLDLMSAAVRIPKRVLLGSERGELASSQDERAWDQRVDERRRDFVEPKIIRPFVDKLIETGALPEPSSKEYVVDWPEISAPTEKETAEVLQMKMEALSKYAGTPGADALIPPEFFLTRFLGLDDEDVEAIMTDMEARLAEEEEEELARQAEAERLAREEGGFEEEEE